MIHTYIHLGTYTEYTEYIFTIFTIIYIMTVMSLDTYYIANTKKVISFIRSVISLQPQG